MLTTLATLKSRLALDPLDPAPDALLTAVIQAVSTRFDRETNRTLARTENATYEFPADSAEILVPCYPLETVSKFELKTSESTGWQEISPTPDFLIHSACIISLSAPFSIQPLAFSLSRVTYTGGYLLPGDTPAPGQTQLPSDLEHAAVEQVAFWYQNREHLGLKTYWPTGVAYHQFATYDLLALVQATLAKYRRVFI